jgi:hypothetical protein
VAAVAYISTIARVAEMLGEDEDWLHDISIEMEPEDGRLYVYGTGADGITAFTAFGIENLQELVCLDRENARRQSSGISSV